MFMSIVLARVVEPQRLSPGGRQVSIELGMDVSLVHSAATGVPVDALVPTPWSVCPPHGPHDERRQLSPLAVSLPKQPMALTRLDGFHPPDMDEPLHAACHAARFAPFATLPFPACFEARGLRRLRKLCGF